MRGGSDSISLWAFQGQLRAQIWAWLHLLASLWVDRMRCCLDHSHVKSLCCPVRTIVDWGGSRLPYQQDTTSSAWVSEGGWKPGTETVLLRLKREVSLFCSFPHMQGGCREEYLCNILIGPENHSWCLPSCLPWYSVYLSLATQCPLYQIRLSKRERIMDGIKERETQDVAGTCYIQYLIINLSQ